MISSDLFEEYEGGDVQTIRLGDYLAGYDEIISDHRPVFGGLYHEIFILLTIIIYQIILSDDISTFVIMLMKRISLLMFR